MAGGDYLVSGGDYLTSSCDYLVSGGDYLASGGDYLTSGDDYLASDGDYRASGGDFLVSGGDYVVSGGDYLASGGDYVASGGDYLTSGGDYLMSGCAVCRILQTDEFSQKICEKQTFIKQKTVERLAKFSPLERKTCACIFVSFALSVMCFYCSFYQTLLNKFENKEGRNHKKRGEKGVILPKRPFKQACPSKNGRLWHTGADYQTGHTLFLHSSFLQFGPIWWGAKFSWKWGWAQNQCGVVVTDYLTSGGAPIQSKKIWPVGSSTSCLVCFIQGDLTTY